MTEMTSDNPVTLDLTFPCTTTSLWKAITDQPQMIQWFFSEIPEFRAEVGFQTEFNIHCNEKQYIHQWEITEVTEGSRIVYNWNYSGINGRSRVYWEISETVNGSKLAFQHVVLEPFQEGVEEFQRESCAEGWNYFLNQNLRKFLESESK